jgi:ribosomal protein S18 acetylase RimI-like enzyme
MASFAIVDGVGYFGTGGVLPVFRRRGVQTALISRRLAAFREDCLTVNRAETKVKECSLMK